MQVGEFYGFKENKNNKFGWFSVFCMLMTQSLSVLAQSPAIVHVEAPTGVHVDPNDKWAIGTTRPTDSGYSSSYYSKLSINGQKVYCLQPLSSIANGNGAIRPWI